VTDGPGAIGEVVAAGRAVLRFAERRLPELVTALAVVVTALCALAMAGAAVDDAAIDDDRAVAGAEVLDGSGFTRTLVRFTTANGQTVIPEHGVFYPGGLAPGDLIAVEYDVTDPELVRVAGRTVASSSWPLLLGVAAVWAVLGPLALWLRRRRRPDSAGG
jgi:hypothetical protein